MFSSAAENVCDQQLVASWASPDIKLGLMFCLNSHMSSSIIGWTSGVGLDLWVIGKHMAVQQGQTCTM